MPSPRLSPKRNPGHAGRGSLGVIVMDVAALTLFCFYEELIIEADAVIAQARAAIVKSKQIRAVTKQLPPPIDRATNARAA